MIQMVPTLLCFRLLLNFFFGRDTSETRFFEAFGEAALQFGTTDRMAGDRRRAASTSAALPVGTEFSPSVAATGLGNISRSTSSHVASGAATTKPSLGQQLLRTFRQRQSTVSAQTISVNVGSSRSAPSSAALLSATASSAAAFDAFQTTADLHDFASADAEKIAAFVPKDAGAAEALLGDIRTALPLTQPQSDEATSVICQKILALTVAVKTSTTFEQQQQEQQSDEASEAIADTTVQPCLPSLSSVFQLCIILLDGDAPLSKLHIYTADLLTASVKLADLCSSHGSMSRSVSVGEAVLDQAVGKVVLTTIDRALFYRLICGLSRSSSGASPFESMQSADGVPAHHVRAAQLRAFCVLSRDGREMVAFPGLIGLLSEWMNSTWVALLAARVRMRLLATLEDEGANLRDKADLASELTVKEWNFHAILELVSNSFKFSFARIPLGNIQSTLRTLCGLVMPFEAPKDIATAQVVPSSEQPLPASQSRPVLSSPLLRPQRRARSKERKPLTEGYSYYGLELNSSESTSPTDTPRLTPRMKPQTLPDSGPELASPPRQKAPAPIVLATLSPSTVASNPFGGSTDGRTSSVCASNAVGELKEEAASIQELDPLIELHTEDLRAIFKVLDSLLRFGLVPPQSVSPIVLMLCRILGQAESADASGKEKAKSVRSDWREQALRIHNNLLRSHYANSAVRTVVDTLAKPTSRSTLANIDKPLLVGGLRFLQSAAQYIDDLAEEAVHSQLQTAKPCSGAGAQEDALAPALSLPIVMPALRGAVQLESDDVDLELIKLFFFITRGRSASAPNRATCLAPTTTMDWDNMLELTAMAKRHLQAIGSSLGTPSFFPQSGEKSKQVKQISSDAKIVSPVVTAFLQFLSSSRFARPGQSGSQADSSNQSLAIPWSRRLASLMLSLSPLLPDDRVTDLVDYYWSQHLCLPCTTDWIANIKALLQAIFYRSDGLAQEFGSTPAPNARQRVVSLVFEHVYVAVFDLPHHRANLMLNVILPLATASFGMENDPAVHSKVRSSLVEAAASAGAAEEVVRLREDGDEDQPALSGDSSLDDNSNVFNAVRELLSKLVRSVPLPKEDRVFCLHSANRATVPKSVHATLDLIAIFNRMAFSAPWTLSSARMEAPNSVHVGEISARRHCVLLFRDLVRIIEDPVIEGKDQSQGRVPIVSRLCALQWALRLRTDRRHRLYVLQDLDDYIEPYARMLGRGRGIHVATTVRDEAPARAGRATERPIEASDRSKSRVREESRDRGRGRGDDAREDSRRARERSRAPPPGRNVADKPLHWHLPQRVLFEMPLVSVRSDIVSTYILKDASSPSAEEPPSAVPLPISELLSAIISILADEQDWDLVSYVLCHLPFQLANRYLFCGPRAQDQVLKLRQLLCSKLPSSSLCSKATLPTELRRTDLIAVAYFTLHILISYRTLFTRSQQDEMVESFLAGLNKSQNTARACVKALSIAAFELQKSFTRLLSGGLVKLSTVMSSTAMSVHILELIVSIGHMPACHANFTEADYRRVFGIALQYIQYHQSPAASSREDFRASPAAFALSQYVMMMAYYSLALWFMLLRVSERPKHMHAIARGLILANEGREKISDQTETMFDFLARATHANAQPKPRRSFINSVLMGPSSVGIGRPGVKDATRITKSWLYGQSIVTFTSLHRKGWVEIVIRRPSGATAMLCKLENEDGVPAVDDLDDAPEMLMSNRDPERLSKPVIKAPPIPVLTVQEHLRRGLSTQTRRLAGPAKFGLGKRPRALSADAGAEIFSRRDQLSDAVLSPTVPSNDATVSSPYQGGENKVTRAMKEIMESALRVEAESQPAKGKQKAEKEQATGTNKTSVVAMTDPSFIALQLSSYPDIDLSRAPLMLPDEPATDRMIRAVDLTPVVDFHKIGVLYVGKGQNTEKEILGNRHGSAAYSRLLSRLGDLIVLKEQQDVYIGGLDRSNDEHGPVAYIWGDEIAQIVYHTATLMPNKVEDAAHRAKKALIGNDWVHIVFNESGEEYKFGTIPSQFNYVNVVISPDSRGGVEFGSVAMDDVIFYRVSLQCRPGMPAFSPVGDGVMVSEDNLADFVRVLALNSNLMSQIYLDTGESMQPYTSNWVSRLHHLTRFRAQLEAKRAQTKAKDEKEAAPMDPHEAITHAACSQPATMYTFSATTAACIPTLRLADFRSILLSEMRRQHSMIVRGRRVYSSASWSSGRPG
ncbi:hypothetical protein K437DRAFT_264412 [Tilletiaria anomala UBC 951]|uniref:Rap-GAP domain-containing protein n=1 Tax=Tilletiaria anomala (strain ATCC 24038 / CBS 436.72 / UBC 951) TaxID=1037660 RepID=A0A066VN08_TILAU|nr:uncharacterized protein K437DRAFT_264412 [Tilletiaria anomala UBC 951]KDN39950.1 hypothetical protein K437DRAFT_264412 [Tilletiaria anomala UBC 951]